MSIIVERLIILAPSIERSFAIGSTSPLLQHPSVKNGFLGVLECRCTELALMYTLLIFLESCPFPLLHQHLLQLLLGLKLL